jgi:hypothetical protein
MQYMFLIYGDEQAMLTSTGAETTTMSPAYTAYNAALANAGVLIGGDRLGPTSTAASVRTRDGKSEVLDGPYAETREQLAGYYIVDVPDLDHAITWASKCPAARNGTIEVRPIWSTRGE